MPGALPPVRRIVTAIDADGKSFIKEDGPADMHELPIRAGMYSQHVWGTSAIPCPADEPDQSHTAPGIMPPRGGSILHIIDYPPEPADPAERARLYETFRERVHKAGTNPEPGQRRFPDAPHPGMHATDTIDYAIVLSGEIYAVMDNDETLMKAGDVLIQRATSHAWSNRSNAPCRVAFVLVEAKPAG